jgi:hypothetical protein
MEKLWGMSFPRLGHIRLIFLLQLFYRSTPTAVDSPDSRVSLPSVKVVHITLDSFSLLTSLLFERHVSMTKLHVRQGGD